MSWWQDSDADDEDEEGEGVQEKKSHKPNEENTPSPLLNTLCGIVFVEEKLVEGFLLILSKRITIKTLAT